MLQTRRGISVAILILTVTFLFYSAHAATSVFLYGSDVPLSESDLQAYLSGDYSNPENQGYNKWVGAGPAPDPFPSIAIAEGTFEHLGIDGNTIDGIYFINHGKQLVKNKKALVLWVIRIPNANDRLPSEFDQDLTLSLWVDWNQDENWKPNERMIHEQLNLYDSFPTPEGELVFFYLSSFDTPDVTQMMGANRGRAEDKDIRHLWSRAVVSYDDPDMSPDGEQIFGDYEDYRLSYLVTPVTFNDN
jgi:hypothetical protein